MLVLAGIVVGAGISASAAPFLFQVKAQRWGLYVAGETALGAPNYMYDNNGSVAVGSVMGSAPASVTLPNKWLASGPYTYTAVLTGYPYFYANIYRTIKQGNFAESFWPKNTVITGMRDESAYPNAAPTSVPGAYVSIMVGPNGFGGPMALNRLETYRGLVTAGGVGTSTLAVTNTVTIHDQAGPTAGDACCAFETRTLLTPSAMGPITGVVWGWNPTFAHLTGTALVYAPTGTISHIGTYTGMDGRNAAGTTGTLTLIAPGIATSFENGLGIPPARDFTQSMLNSVSVVRQVLRTTITTIPEPTQITLLAGGIVTLLVIARRRRS